MKPSSLLLALAASAALTAQTPRVSNASVQTRSAAGGLETAFRGLVSAQDSPAWIGYAVPMVPGHNSCCFGSDRCCAGCSLEGRGGTFTGGAQSPVRLEGSTHQVVLFRVAQRIVGKIRTFSADCELDAAGASFHWLTDVRVSESLALLELFANASESDVAEARRLADGAVSAIALHADPGADPVLERLSGPARRESVRKQAIFWMGNARGRRGYEQLVKIVREDPADRVREHAIFALTQSPQPEAVKTIITVAREDKSAHVRGQALFWLAQKAGREAASAISDAIENDPETEVKRRAVFALSQLPKDEGVPLLIQVARTHRNPAVRKQAMFWLGQSKDQRAVKFFEDVLTR